VTTLFKKAAASLEVWQRSLGRLLCRGVLGCDATSLEIRRVIYTADAIESLHLRVRKIIKTRGHFTSDKAAIRLVWLALRNITAGCGARQKNGEMR
jgi:transposase-like protein